MATFLNMEDVTTWTLQGVQDYTKHYSTTKPKRYYFNFYGWTEDEYAQAKACVIRELEQYDIGAAKVLPYSGERSKFRATVQRALIDNHPELFRDRHGPNPPAWFVTSTVDPNPPAEEHIDKKVTIQTFISHAFNADKKVKAAGKSASTAKASSRQSNLASPAPASSSVSPYSPVSASSPVSLYSPTSVNSPASTFSPHLNLPVQLGEIVQSPQWYADAGKSVSEMPFTGIQDPSSLTIYITRVTAVNQDVFLERDRFAFFDWLFEHGQLDEARFRELVFGSSLDNSPFTLWWYNQNTAKDNGAKVWSIRSRIGAETALRALRNKAGKDATGIQLFEGQNREVMEMLPIGEATREDDFEEEVVFHT